MVKEIKVGETYEIIANHVKHGFKIGDKVCITNILYNTYTAKNPKTNEWWYVVKGDLKEIKNKTNKMTQTPTQKIEQVAKDLAVANNTVTTLEIKTELRKRYPNEKWYQSDISDVMDDLNSESKFSYTDNGTFRVYSLVVKPKTTTSVLKTTTKNMSTTKSTTVQNKTVTKISRTKALDLIKETNGKFFGVTFTKKDNTERKMRCRTYQDSKPSVLGYVLVVDTEEAKPKSLNLQTISELRMNKKVYKIS